MTNRTPPHSWRRAKSPSAFTLIELLIVITIIMILAALVVGGATYANRAAAENRARSEIRALELALQEYRLDNGEYPPVADVANGVLNTNPTTYLSPSINLYRMLIPTPAPAPNPPPKVYFRDVPKGMVGTSGNDRYFIDPWGNPYGWSRSTNTSHNPNFPEVSIWSVGVTPANTNAWITNFGSN